MLKDISFQKKLLLTYSLTIIVIIALSLAVFFFFISNMIERNAVDHMRQIAERSSEQINLFMKDLDKVALQVIFNPTIQERFQQLARQPDSANYFETHFSESQDIIDILTSINGPNLSALRISLYNYYYDYISLAVIPDDRNNIETFLDSPQFDLLVEQVKRQKGGRYIIPRHHDFWSPDSSSSFISLMREIRTLEVPYPYGIVEIQTSYDILKEICTFPDSSDMRVYLVEENGNLIYPSAELATWNAEQALALQYLSLLGEQDDSTEGLLLFDNQQTGQHELVTYYKSGFTHWTLFFVQTRQALLAPVMLIVKVAIGLGLAIIALSVWIVSVLTRRLTTPLVQLTRSLDQVNLDHPTMTIDVQDSRNEFVHLETAFKHMLQRLQSSMAQVMELRSQELHAHVLALQSQMNPHFLYNMLATISAVAQEVGSEDIMEMSHVLGKMLRYVTSYKTDTITIRDELEHAVDYLYLMKQRYEDSFDYQIDCDDSVLEVKVPKLILQPLLENCFAHGFSTVEPPWHIHVRIYADESFWRLDVTDNGSGFDESVLARLFHNVEEFTQHPALQIQERHLGGIGLFNSILRLRQQYGAAMIFEVVNHPQQGTTVRIGGPRS